MEFISYPIKNGEMPDPCIVVEEINMVFFTQLQAMYYLMSDENLLSSASLVEQMMFVFLAQWKNWQNDFFNHVKNAKDKVELPKDISLLCVPGKKYTLDEIEMMKNFWVFIHSKEKSKHFETFKSVLELAANEDTKNGDVAEGGDT